MPVFVDVELGTYSISAAHLEETLYDKTKCVFVAHTLGNPINLMEIRNFCDKHNLWLIEENCDALGVEYDIGYGF